MTSLIIIIIIIIIITGILLIIIHGTHFFSHYGNIINAHSYSC